ncbi:MAG: hypothetical protein NTW21_12470 [Verrucomicrobia bacterium]|nr:hypothetical protein [Verrucomicrobiota bacterium]
MIKWKELIGGRSKPQTPGNEPISQPPAAASGPPLKPVEQPDPQVACGKDGSSWERKLSSAKSCTQVIFHDSEPVPTQPKVKDHLINGTLMRCAWGLWPVKLAESDSMDLYAKASGIAAQLKSLPCKFALAFYAFPEAALLQFFLEIQLDRRNPFVVECSCDVTNPEMRDAFQEILALDEITIHFLDGNMSPEHSRKIKKSPEAKQWMAELWQAALQHEQGILRGSRDYQRALQRYNAANPVEQSPII